MLMLLQMHLLLDAGWDESTISPAARIRSEKPEEKVQAGALYDFINKVQLGRSP